MMKTSGSKTTVKIIDFGLAVVHKPGDPPLTAFAGSAFTVAPEVIQRNYGREVDLWSTGVITYFLLMHIMPFNAQSNEEMFKKIQSGVFYYPKWARDGISNDAKDFIERLLVVDPKQRMSAKQALSHSWIRKFHVTSSQTGMASLALVLYNKDESGNPKKPASSRKNYENARQRDPPASTQALVLYDDRDKHTQAAPRQRHHRGKQSESRKKYVHKASKPRTNLEPQDDADRIRVRRESERKLHRQRHHH